MFFLNEVKNIKFLCSIDISPTFMKLSKIFTCWWRNSSWNVSITFWADHIAPWQKKCIFFLNLSFSVPRNGRYLHQFCFETATSRCEKIAEILSKWNHDDNTIWKKFVSNNNNSNNNIKVIHACLQSKTYFISLATATVSLWSMFTKWLNFKRIGH